MTAATTTDASIQRQPRCSSLCRFLAFVAASLYVTLPIPVNGASWLVAANVTGDDGQICRFELPIEMLFAAPRTLATMDRLCIYSLVIEGPLEVADAATLKKVVGFFEENSEVRRPSEIHLNTPGGSVTAALAIATELRRESSPLFGLSGFVGAADQCLSSCVILLAAAQQRTVFGPIGIHRPRFIGDEYHAMGYDSLRSAYDGLYRTLREFFSSTNIHPSLIDDMWMIPSNELRLLSDRELEKYGLNRTDLLHEEKRILSIVARCGDTAPALEKDFLEYVHENCADRSGRIDSSCYHRVLGTHPWKECSEKLRAR